MNTEDSLLEGLSLALRTETEGKNFYNEAAAKTNDSMSKSVFSSLAEQEDDHIKLINSFFNKLKETNEWDNIDEFIKKEGMKIEGVKSVFRTAYDTIEDKFNPPETNIETYKLAKEFEDKAVSLYKKLLNQAKDPQAKRFFEFLIEMEEEHYKLLDNTIRYLEAPANWFQSQEGWLLEG